MKRPNDRLLVVDDDETVHHFFARIAERSDVEVAFARSPAQMRSALRTFRPRLVILGTDDSVVRAADRLKLMNDSGSTASVILLCDGNLGKTQSATTLGQMLGLRMCGTLPKPIDVESIFLELGRFLSPGKAS